MLQVMAQKGVTRVLTRHMKVTPIGHGQGHGGRRCAAPPLSGGAAAQASGRLAPGRPTHTIQTFSSLTASPLRAAAVIQRRERRRRRVITGDSARRRRALMVAARQH